MFSKCLSLKEIYISDFNINVEANITDMFLGCSFELEKKISDANKNRRV